MKFLHEFFKYPGVEKPVDNGMWRITDGGMLINRCGGHNIYVPTPDDIIYEADSWEDLPWEEILLNPNSEYGWLDHDGNFYGCAFKKHSDVAKFILKSTERELEVAGWIKTYQDYSGETRFYCENFHMTKQQKDFLISRNLYVEN